MLAFHSNALYYICDVHYTYFLLTGQYYAVFYSRTKRSTALGTSNIIRYNARVWICRDVCDAHYAYIP